MITHGIRCVIRVTLRSKSVPPETAFIDISPIVHPAKRCKYLETRDTIGETSVRGTILILVGGPVSARLGGLVTVGASAGVDAGTARTAGDAAGPRQARRDQRGILGRATGVSPQAASAGAEPGAQEGGGLADGRVTPSEIAAYSGLMLDARNLVGQAASERRSPRSPAQGRQDRSAAAVLKLECQARVRGGRGEDKARHGSRGFPSRC